MESIKSFRNHYHKLKTISIKKNPETQYSNLNFLAQHIRLILKFA